MRPRSVRQTSPATILPPFLHRGAKFHSWSKLHTGLSKLRYLFSMANSAPIKHQPRPMPEAEEVYRRWLEFLDEEFNRHQSADRRADIVREQLAQLYLGKPLGVKSGVPLTSELAGHVLALALDPRNITLEAEHYTDIDQDRYARLKPLLWFWQMFDRSSLGLNHWLGIRFRCMLGRHIFEHLGSGVKIHHGVNFAYGYNLWIGDSVVIRQQAMLQDRGGIRIGDHAQIGSFARIYSHVHQFEQHDQVRLETTVIGEHARIASHAIVLAGQHVAPGETVGHYPGDSQ